MLRKTAVLQQVSAAPLLSSLRTWSRKLFARNISSGLLLSDEELRRLAAAGNAERRYFYEIDEHGQIFCLPVKHRSIATALKDNAFIDFFTKRIKRNTTGYMEEYFPYVSPCGKEMNFIASDDVPFVFHKIVKGNTPTDSLLIYGATLTMHFDPASVYISASGRFYHPLIRNRRSSSDDENSNGVKEIGLIKSSLAVELGRSIFPDDTKNGKYVLEWMGKRYPLNMESDAWMYEEKTS